MDPSLRKYAFNATVVPVKLRSVGVPPTATPALLAAEIAPFCTASVTVSDEESTSAKGVPRTGHTRFPRTSSFTPNTLGAETVGALFTAAMLRMLGREEVESILVERETVEVNCDFCNLAYRFDAVDAAGLFLPGADHPPPTQPQ